MDRVFAFADDRVIGSHRLQNDGDIPEYLAVWVATSVPNPRQRSIAAFCRRLWRKNQRGGIPYAFSRVGAVRYRPEEVAAAMALAPPPATFQQAEKLGRQILERINER